MRADICIVGGGTAGLAAAATAEELGLTSLVIEKTDRLGGQLDLSSGHFSAAGTRRQRERGIDDHPDFHFEDVMRLSNGLANPALVRLAVDAAPEMVDWLHDHDFPFADEAPAIVTGHEAYGVARTYWGGETVLDGGPALRGLLVPLVLDAGGCKVLTRRVVTRLVVEDGEVAAVEAAGAGGSERVDVRSVLLTTGGYASNASMVQMLQPLFPDAISGCGAHSTGDGHGLLMELGVAMTHGDTYCPTMGMIPNPDRPGYGFSLRQARLIVNAHNRSPWEVWLNSDGERFVAEDTLSPFDREQALRLQPGLRMVAVWDEAAMRSGSPMIGPDWTLSEIRAVAGSNGWLYVAGTIDELCEAADLPAGVVHRTLATYNSADPDPYGRRHSPTVAEPPFYAVVTIGGMLLTRAGPKVDDRLQPLTEDGRPIAGLHAVGELLGMGQFSGDSFAGGMSVGPALSLGRWTVQQIADGWRGTRHGDPPGARERS